MIKRKLFIKIVSLAMVSSTLLCGCGDDTTNDPNKDGVGVESSDSTNPSDNTNVSNNGGMLEVVGDKVKTMLSDLTDDDKLEEAIIVEEGLDEDTAKKTRYYYNSVDLDGDSKEEVIVETVGPDDGYSTGYTAIVFKKNDDGTYTTIQKFEGIRNPIIISDSQSNGYKDIIVEKASESAPNEYLILKYDGSKYSDVETSEALGNLNEVTGVAIITNDFDKEVTEQKGMYLS